MYQRILVISNPVSGRHDASETRNIIEERLKAEGITYEVRETQQEGDALNWACAAQDDGFDLVLASGGDGTIMEAMSGLIKSGGQIPLAQMPVGTANLLARALLIPTDREKAMDTIFLERTERLDVGYLPEEDRYFALVAGAGYDAQMIGDTSREIKNVLGFAAYLVSGIKNLFKLRRVNIDLEVDGRRRRFRAHTVMIINVGQMGEHLIQLGPNIHPHDGKLDLMIASSASLRGAVRILFQIITRQFNGNTGLTYISATKVRISAHPPLPTEIDGEELGTTPLYAEAVPDGALLVVGQDYKRAQDVPR